MAPPEPHQVPNEHHHAPLSWGYSSSWNTPVTSAVPSSRPVKRPVSESDDCDDVFSEESKDHCSADGDETDSCQLLSRKKRRGVIEKRRRDRINTSLSELRRLVPSAFEKQGSAKLEKAEILQMTVDHLKMLHAKGLDALAYDPQRFAMDYHSIGFRECAAEVARYLVTVEGLDIQDPLRMRLMSHLQCFAAQRELASKQAAATTAPWSYAATTPVSAAPHHHHHAFPTPPPSAGHGHHHVDSPSAAPPPPPSSGLTPLPPPPPTSSAYDHCEQPSTPRHQNNPHSHHPQSPSLTPHTPGSYSTTASPNSHPAYHPSQYNINPYPNQNSFSPAASSSAAAAAAAAQMKPYRPWGAEVAY